MASAFIGPLTTPRSCHRQRPLFVLALRLILAWLAAGASVATAPLAAQQEYESLPRNSAIEGVVVKATSGEPLRRATVRLNNLQGGQPQNLSATTGHSGHFLFQNLTPGTYSLHATRHGYIDRGEFDRSQGRSVTTLEVRPGEAVRDVAFRLQAAVIITGRVLDEAGEPLSGATVGAMEFTWSQGRTRLQPVGNGQSNDLGEYRIFGLRPGRYYLYAQYPQFDSAEGGTDEFGDGQAYAPIYYPGTVDFLAAQRLLVRPGENLTGMDFQLIAVRAVTVRGQVLNARTGQPAVGGYLTLVRRDSVVMGYESQMGAGTQDASGAFEFRGVPPGEYFVTGQWSEKDEQFHGRTAVSVGGSDVEGVTISIAPGFAINGQVRMEGGDSSDSQFYVQLEPRGMPHWGGRGGQVKQGGNFTFDKVFEDEYRVLVHGIPGDCYLKSAAFGGEGSSDATVSISRDRLSQRLEIVVSCPGGHIQGKVLNVPQKTAGALQVVLVPDSHLADRQDLYKITSTDERGNFTLDGIAPGDYKLYAWQAEEGVAFLDPDFADAFESGGESVHVSENSTSHVELRVIPVTLPPG